MHADDRQRDPTTDVAPLDEHVAPIYDELRRLASHHLRGERAGHTLRPTALVHEAYLRLAGRTETTLRGRSHALALMARAMRQILIDHARKHNAAKRQNDEPWLVLDETMVMQDPGTLIDLERALIALEELDPRAARFVELRFFGGLKAEEIAEIFDVTDRTVRAELAHARGWLQSRLD